MDKRNFVEEQMNGALEATWQFDPVEDAHPLRIEMARIIGTGGTRSDFQFMKTMHRNTYLCLHLNYCGAENHLLLRVDVLELGSSGACMSIVNESHVVAHLDHGFVSRCASGILGAYMLYQYE